ncbi:RNase A-like domain-containing protein [Kitasatospora sp. NPDC056138]|uniref:RNase A-like domain-containing protein n=1 Tax=Kitasatospora sp. NPDC056138 TaxID=3345724 RepID=UPI0035E12B9F
MADEGDKHGAHTLKDHVLSDADAQTRADDIGTATKWKDQDTAVRAVGKAYQQWIAKPANLKRLESWMAQQSKRGGAFDPRLTCSRSPGRSETRANSVACSRRAAPPGARRPGVPC